MQGLRVHLIAHDPLIITDGSSEGISHKSLAYIPGSMLLGAMALRWKQKNSGDPDASPEFCDIFLNGLVSFGHAYPEVLGRQCLPTPLCLEYLKSKGGLPGMDENDTTAPHVFNKLIPEVETSTNDKDTENNKEKEKRKRLSSPFLDFASKHIPNVAHLQTTHVAINHRTRKAADHRLYAFESIAKGTTFLATILCADRYVQTVEELLKMSDSLHFGHARSSGYGSTKITAIERTTVQEEIAVSKGEHILFLESAFFPEKSWQSPRNGLLEALQATSTGEIAFGEPVFCKNIRLEGFNSLWFLPRATRIGFAQGSVFNLHFAADAKVPTILGKWSQEGYGRILFDPELLKQKDIIPEQITIESSQKTLEPIAKEHEPFLAVWRMRTYKRVAFEQAIDCVWHSDVFKEFFANMRQEPSKNQRGNIRNMLLKIPAIKWKEQFSTMLDKVPGEQWKNATTKDPFSSNNKFLDKIMLDLLDPIVIDQKLGKINSIDWNFPEVAGSALTTDEKKEFCLERHTRLLLELLRRWEKK